MVGSSFYVESVVSAIRGREGDGAVIGELHSDIIGYNEGESEAVMETCNQAATIDEAILRALEALDSPINLSSACITPSDHVRFWEVGLPAAMMVESMHPREGYPWYHQPGDTMDKLDIP